MSLNFKQLIKIQREFENVFDKTFFIIAEEDKRRFPAFKDCDIIWVSNFGADHPFALSLLERCNEKFNIPFRLPTIDEAKAFFEFTDELDCVPHYYKVYSNILTDEISKQGKSVKVVSKKWFTSKYITEVERKNINLKSFTVIFVA